ncbi:MAG: PD40 domain-containing protein [Anaerolineae bacterium]|nr:PD40 domain-containing protein [Anaerolineae bacterium]
MKTKMCLVVVVLLVVITGLNGNSSRVHAQQEDLYEMSKGVSLVDVPFRKDYVISLPKEWLVWKVENYPSRLSGLNQLSALLAKANPGVTQSYAQSQAGMLSNHTLVAFRPRGSVNSYILLHIDVIPFDTAAKNMSIEPSAVTAEAYFQSIKGKPLDDTKPKTAGVVNERAIAIGIVYEVLTTVYAFPTQKTLVVVSLGGSKIYNTELASLVGLIVTSARLKGESIDKTAWQQYDTKAEAIPAWIGLPGQPAPKVVTAPTRVSTASAAATGRQKLLFTSSRDGNEEIYVVNSDGSQPINLTKNRADDAFPSWSPDRKQIVFVSDRAKNGGYDIYVMNADGTKVVNLTKKPGQYSNPHWSPDGKQIAYSFGPQNKEDIYVMNADGKNPVNITNNDDSDQYPRWSPDGKQITFQSNRSGSVQIHVMDVDGSNATVLTSGPSYFPDWSPDGKQIAYSANVDGNIDVFVMNADGSNQRNLTSAPNRSVESLPVWSPDGKQVAFSSNAFGNYRIFMITVDGEKVNTVTKTTKGNDYLSDW